MRQELGLSLVQAGWVQSALNTVAVTLATVIGLQVGRFGALRLALGGLLLGAAASLATLAQTGATWLLACRVLEGAGFVAVAVAGPALISAAAAERDRRFALGVWSGYLPAGVGLAMAGAPWLLPAAGWRGLWVATALGLLAAAALHLEPAPPLPTARGPPPERLRKPPWRRSAAAAAAALRQPLPWLLGLCFGAWTVQHFALIVWLPTFLIEQRGLATGPVVALSCVMVLANVPGNLLGGTLLQRGVPRGLLLATAHSCTGLAALGLFNDALPDGLALCAVRVPVVHRRADSFVGDVLVGSPGPRPAADRHAAGPVHAVRAVGAVRRHTAHCRGGQRQRPVEQRALGHGGSGFGGPGPGRCRLAARVTLNHARRAKLRQLALRDGADALRRVPPHDPHPGSALTKQGMNN